MFFCTFSGCTKDFLTYHNCDIEESDKVYRLEDLHEMSFAERNGLIGKIIVLEGKYLHHSEGRFLYGNSNDEIVFALEFSYSQMDSAGRQVLTWKNSERMNGAKILVKGKFDPKSTGHLNYGEAGITDVCFFGRPVRNSY